MKRILVVDDEEDICEILKFNLEFAGYEVDGAALFWLISFSLTILGFFTLYWTIPNRSVPIRAAMIAAVFSAVTFELLKNLFGFVMTNFTSYQLVYGAFAAIPIFLLWIFLSWNVILLGVEISYAITAFHTGKTQTRHPVLMLLDMLELPCLHIFSSYLPQSHLLFSLGTVR